MSVNTKPPSRAERIKIELSVLAVYEDELQKLIEGRDKTRRKAAREICGLNVGDVVRIGSGFHKGKPGVVCEFTAAAPIGSVLVALFRTNGALGKQIVNLAPDDAARAVVMTDAEIRAAKLQRPASVGAATAA